MSAVLVTGAAKRLGARDCAQARGRRVTTSRSTIARARPMPKSVGGEVKAARPAGGVGRRGIFGRSRGRDASCRARRRRSGHLTALVNSASVFEDDRVETATRASWDKHLETNLRAPLVLSQRFAPSNSRRGGRDRQYHRSGGDQSDAAVLVLHGVEGGAVDADPDFGASAGARDPRQRGGAGAVAEGRAAVSSEFRRAGAGDAAAAPVGACGHCGGRALSSVGARGDRPDDCRR